MSDGLPRSGRPRASAGSIQSASGVESVDTTSTGTITIDGVSVFESESGCGESAPSEQDSTQKSIKRRDTEKKTVAYREPRTFEWKPTQVACIVINFIPVGNHAPHGLRFGSDVCSQPHHTDSNATNNRL